MGHNEKRGVKSYRIGGAAREGTEADGEESSRSREVKREKRKGRTPLREGGKRGWGDRPPRESSGATNVNSPQYHPGKGGEKKFFDEGLRGERGRAG